MSTINNLGNSGYYQLSNPTGGQAGGTSGSGQTGSTQALIQALSGDTNSNNANSNDAYLLSLSPQAKQYLSNTANGTNQSFILSDKQKQTITDILTKYKDAPYNQDTFNKIQNDLNAAGLSTTTLSLLDKSKSFSATSVLISALNGGIASGADAGGVPSETEEQTKSSSYIQNIISQWKNLSGHSKDTTPASTTSSTAVAPVGSTSGS